MILAPLGEQKCRAESKGNRKGLHKKQSLQQRIGKTVEPSTWQTVYRRRRTQGETEFIYEASNLKALGTNVFCGPIAHISCLNSSNLLVCSFKLKLCTHLFRLQSLESPRNPELCTSEFELICALHPSFPGEFPIVHIFCFNSSFQSSQNLSFAPSNSNSPPTFPR